MTRVLWINPRQPTRPTTSRTRSRGGSGDPRERPVDDVVEDVKDGYVTVEQAERDNGVVLDGETNEVREARR